MGEERQREERERERETHTHTARSQPSIIHLNEYPTILVVKGSNVLTFHPFAWFRYWQYDRSKHLSVGLVVCLRFSFIKSKRGERHVRTHTY